MSDFFMNSEVFIAIAKWAEDQTNLEPHGTEIRIDSATGNVEVYDHKNNVIVSKRHLDYFK